MTNHDVLIARAERAVSEARATLKDARRALKELQDDLHNKSLRDRRFENQCLLETQQQIVEECELALETAQARLKKLRVKAYR